jgi:hypothetical protein
MPDRFEGWINRKSMASKSTGIEREVQEEISFHCDQLTAQYQAEGLSETEARLAALKQFGDVEQVHAECVQISKRTTPLTKVIRLLLFIMFLAGVWIRFSGLGITFVHLGNVLIATAILARLLMYVQTLRPIKSGPGETLRLSAKSSSSKVEAFDSLGQTPVERLMNDRSDD